MKELKVTLITKAMQKHPRVEDQYKALGISPVTYWRWRRVYKEEISQKLMESAK